MKIGYLGAGAWGFCLASLLASKSHDVVSWTIFKEQADTLNAGKDHPNLPGHKLLPNMRVTTNLEEALQDIDILVESVTSDGLRPVCEQLKKMKLPACPFIITSKGIEQDSGLILPDIVTEVLGKEIQQRIGVISGPSFAVDVVKGLPTSVVGSAYNKEIMMQTCDLFTTQTFRVYPNSDIRGVCYGGALKNIIAIACGIAEGLNLGLSARAALVTRGLHEIRKLATANGCKPETLYGLSGMGDLCLTCSSPTSRNFRYGYLLTQGLTSEKVQKKIGMVVEGINTCVSALQLSQKYNIPMPITETIYNIVYKDIKVTDAIQALMTRPIKEEHL